MAVFTCSGAIAVSDMAFLNCSTGVVGVSGAFPWIGSASATCADDGANVSLLSTEAPQDRACGTYSQPTTISNQWVGTLTYGAAYCIASAGNFWATGCGASTGTLLMSGDFTQIPVSSSDSIQFTLTLSVT